jgi:seryl-tRNA synthetase
MLDLNFIKENKEKVSATLKSRNLAKKVDLEGFLSDYEAYLSLLKNVETHRSLRNKLSEDISKVVSGEKEKLIAEATEVKKELQETEDELNKLKAKIDEQLQYIPNVNSEKMPIGKGEADNLVTKVWLPGKGYLEIEGRPYEDNSYMSKVSFVHKDHIELGALLDVIDVEQSSKVSGSRFCYIKNELAIVQDAISFILKKKLLEKGFNPLIPPILVKERSLFGTSHFPEGKNQVYKIESSNVEEENELYLVGSSEPTNFSYFMDKILDISDLPIKVYAQTSCFRSEVGSWGKDVRGIKRVHQFDKLEMNAVCAEGQDEEVFDEFLSINEWLFQQLEIPYRLVNKCSGDCGYNASHYQFDIEVWRPGEKEFMEAGTDTMTTDYQARRLNIRYKDGNKIKIARTVNDTGVAFGRALIAILENHQNEDGSINLPKSLVSYTGFDKIAPKSSKY